MARKAFHVTGHFKMGRMDQPFKIEVIGADETEAREHAFAEFGSRHGVDRNHIWIDKVTAIAKEKASGITRKRLQGSS